MYLKIMKQRKLKSSMILLISLLSLIEVSLQSRLLLGVYTDASCDVEARSMDIFTVWGTGANNYYAIGYLSKYLVEANLLGPVETCVQDFVPILKVQQQDEGQTGFQQTFSMPFATTLYTSDTDTTGEFFNDILSVRWPMKQTFSSNDEMGQVMILLKSGTGTLSLMSVNVEQGAIAGTSRIKANWILNQGSAANQFDYSSSSWEWNPSMAIFKDFGTVGQNIDFRYFVLGRNSTSVGMKISMFQQGAGSSLTYLSQIQETGTTIYLPSNGNGAIVAVGDSVIVGGGQKETTQAGENINPIIVHLNKALGFQSAFRLAQILEPQCSMITVLKVRYHTSLPTGDLRNEVFGLAQQENCYVEKPYILIVTFNLGTSDQGCSSTWFIKLEDQNMFGSTVLDLLLNGPYSGNQQTHFGLVMFQTGSSEKRPMNFKATDIESAKIKVVKIIYGMKCTSSLSSGQVSYEEYTAPLSENVEVFGRALMTGKAAEMKQIVAFSGFANDLFSYNYIGAYLAESTHLFTDAQSDGDGKAQFPPYVDLIAGFSTPNQGKKFIIVQGFQTNNAQAELPTISNMFTINSNAKLYNVQDLSQASASTSGTAIAAGAEFPVATESIENCKEHEFSFNWAQGSLVSSLERREAGLSDSVGSKTVNVPFNITCSKNCNCLRPVYFLSSQKNDQTMIDPKFALEQGVIMRAVNRQSISYLVQTGPEKTVTVSFVVFLHYHQMNADFLIQPMVNANIVQSKSLYTVTTNLTEDSIYTTLLDNGGPVQGAIYKVASAQKCYFTRKNCGTSCLATPHMHYPSLDEIPCPTIYCASTIGNKAEQTSINQTSEETLPYIKTFTDVAKFQGDKTKFTVKLLFKETGTETPKNVVTSDLYNLSYAFVDRADGWTGVDLTQVASKAFSQEFFVFVESSCASRDNLVDKEVPDLVKLLFTNPMIYQMKTTLTLDITEKVSVPTTTTTTVNETVSAVDNTAPVVQTAEDQISERGGTNPEFAGIDPGVVDQESGEEQEVQMAAESQEVVISATIEAIITEEAPVTSNVMVEQFPQETVVQRIEVLSWDSEVDEEDEYEILAQLQQAGSREVMVPVRKGDWQKLASQDQVQDLFSEMQRRWNESLKGEKVEKFEEIEEPKTNKEPIQVSLSRDGILKIDFRDKIEVPGFGKTTVKGRKLFEAQEIDFQRDLFEVQFVMTSGEKIKDLKFTIDTLDFTENQISAFFNFSSPEFVSKGQIRDSLTIIPRKQSSFIKQGTSESFFKEDLKLKITVPQQLPKGVSEKQITQRASSASNSLESLIIIQIILQVILKGLKNGIMPLYLSMQVMAFMNIYSISYPANVAIYISEFRKMVKFEIIKPDVILDLIQPGLTVQILIGDVKSSLQGSMDNANLKSPSLLVNLAVYIGMGALFIGSVSTLVIMSGFEKFKKPISKKLQKIKKDTFFNNLIKGQTISYIELTVVLFIKLRYITLPQVIATPSDNISIICIGLFLLSYPVACALVLLLNQDKLDSPKFHQMYSILYCHLKYKKGWAFLLYYPIFIVKRLLFVLIPTFVSQGFVQLQLFISCQLLFIMYEGYFQAHLEKEKVKISVFNEIVMMLLLYHMLCFTDLLLDPLGQFYLGDSYVYIALGFMVINISIILSSSIKVLLQNRRVKKVMVLRAKTLENIKLEREAEAVEITSDEILAPTPLQSQIRGRPVTIFRIHENQVEKEEARQMRVRQQMKNLKLPVKPLNLLDTIEEEQTVVRNQDFDFQEDLQASLNDEIDLQAALKDQLGLKMQPEIVISDFQRLKQSEKLVNQIDGIRSRLGSERSSLSNRSLIHDGEVPASSIPPETTIQSDLEGTRDLLFELKNNISSNLAMGKSEEMKKEDESAFRSPSLSVEERVIPRVSGLLDISRTARREE